MSIKIKKIKLIVWWEKTWICSFLILPLEVNTVEIRLTLRKWFLLIADYHTTITTSDFPLVMWLQSKFMIRWNHKKARRSCLHSSICTLCFSYFDIRSANSCIQKWLIFQILITDLSLLIVVLHVYDLAATISFTFKCIAIAQCNIKQQMFSVKNEAKFNYT